MQDNIGSLDQAGRFFVVEIMSNRLKIMPNDENTHCSHLGTFTITNPGKGHSGEICRIYEVVCKQGFGHGVDLKCTRRCFLFFKRRWYETFGIEYNHPQRVGQSVNLRALQRAERENGHIVIIMPDRSVHSMHSKNWLSFVNDFTTYRIPSTEREYEASVPAGHLRRLN